VAVVGCSPNPARPSNQIARYLIAAGYHVVPVNPGHREILGEACFPSLLQIPEELRIDVVDIFRRSEAVGPIADQVIARGVPFVFMQFGVVDAVSARRLEEAGVGVAMDRCILVEHRRLSIPSKTRNEPSGTRVASMSPKGIKS
jgi:predicted CoA-binding protein